MPETFAEQDSPGTVPLAGTSSLWDEEAAMADVPSRESAAAKARRYLTEGRVSIVCADRHGKVRALVRGDGAIWLVKVDGYDRTCTCPAPKLCAHILAVGLVTAPYQPKD